MLTGIGGQSVQLAAQVLARAAVAEGRHVTTLGTYGGTMRGGNTDSTVIVGDEPIASPPIVASTWAALAMHHAHWEPLRGKLRAGSVVVVNASLFAGELDRDAQRVFEVPATQVATDLGNPLAASLVLLGAFASLSALLGLPALVEAMRASVPAYRSQHLASNERALEAGFACAPCAAAPAWARSA